MYLIHNTSTSLLKSILKDGELKSYSLLKKINKTPKYSEGDGLYTENKFVYFSCTNKLFDKKILSDVTLYFNSKLLFNKSFYVSTMHSPEPDNLGEWLITNEDGTKYKVYKRKYNRYYTKYNTVLKKLYDSSVSQLNGEAFQVFQQVAVRNKVKLNELVAIQFNNDKLVTDNIINYITKHYPYVKIKKNKFN
jgi:hypothetical protein